MKSLRMLVRSLVRFYPCVEKKVDEEAPLWTHCAILLVLLTRLSLHVTDPQLWAEDGVVFFNSAYLRGIYSLVEPYAGYLHLVPRLISFIGSEIVPMDVLPTYYFWMSVLMVISVGEIWLCARSIDLRLRFVMALVLMAVPSSGEVYGNVTNLHWFLVSLFVFVLFSTPASNGRSCLLNLCLLTVAGLSSPLVCAFLPFFCWRFLVLWRRYFYERIVLAGAVLLVVIQCICIFTTLGDSLCAPSSDRDAVSLSGWLQIFMQIPTGLLLGQVIPRMVRTNSLLLGACCLYCGCMISVFVFAFMKASFLVQRIVFLLFSAGTTSLALSFYRYISCPMHFTPFEADRYFHIPYYLWLSAVVILMVCRDTRDSLRFLLRVSTMLIFFCSSFSFVVPRRLDSHWRQRVAELERCGMTTIQIAPGTPAWLLTIRRDRHQEYEERRSLAPPR